MSRAGQCAASTVTGHITHLRLQREVTSIWNASNWRSGSRLPNQVTAASIIARRR